jgi:hypothetical protein
VGRATLYKYPKSSLALGIFCGTDYKDLVGFGMALCKFYKPMNVLYFLALAEPRFLTKLLILNSLLALV